MDVYAYRFHDICPFSKTFESLQSRSYIWDANHHQGALFFFRIAKVLVNVHFPRVGDHPKMNQPNFLIGISCFLIRISKVDLVIFFVIS